MTHIENLASSLVAFKLRLTDVFRLLACSLCLAGTVHAGQVLDLSRMPEGYLAGQAQYLFESDTRLTLEQVQSGVMNDRWTAGSWQVPGYGVGARSVWLHWRFNNPTTSDLAFHLAVGPTWLDHIEVYQVREGKLQMHWSAGDESAKPEGLQAGRGYEQTVEFAPGATDLYLRVQSVDPMLIAVEMLRPEHSAEQEQQIHYAYGFIYGFLLALVAYNAMLYAGLRERSHFLYSVYLSALIVLDVAYTGHGFAWLWPGQPDLQRYVILVMMVVFASCGLLFARRFLDLQSHAPRVNKAIKRCSEAAVAAIALCVVLQSHLAAALLAFGIFGSFTVTMVALGVLTVRHGRVAGRYFLAAVSCGMLGGGTTFLVVLGLVPYNTVTYHALEMGIILEATLLALAVAYQMRQHQEASFRAEHRASHDALTGLLNRRAFAERARAAWSTSLRSGRPVSLILLDLDFFKTINDQHGHAAGDQALVHSAQILEKACRDGDLLARWGGEEFLYLLPDTDEDQACQFAERVRQKFEESRAPAGNLDIPVTVSLGVARADVHANLEIAIKEADAALYVAKRTGRNRVVSARGQGSGQLPLADME